MRPEAEATGAAPSTPREQQRKSQLKDLKRKYGLEKQLEAADGPAAAGYLDRAEERRRVHGIDPLHAKTETASLDTAIRQENKGYGMLQKMGWAAGSGLGRDGQGRQEPVTVETRPALAGLGSAAAALPPLERSQQEKRKNEIWKKTRKRFKTTPLLEAFAASSGDEEEGGENGVATKGGNSASSTGGTGTNSSAGATCKNSSAGGTGATSRSSSAGGTDGTGRSSSAARTSGTDRSSNTGGTGRSSSTGGTNGGSSESRGSSRTRDSSSSRHSRRRSDSGGKNGKSSSGTGGSKHSKSVKK